MAEEMDGPKIGEGTRRPCFARVSRNLPRRSPPSPTAFALEEPGVFEINAAARYCGDGGGYQDMLNDVIAQNPPQQDMGQGLER